MSDAAAPTTPATETTTTIVQTLPDEAQPAAEVEQPAEAEKPAAPAAPTDLEIAKRFEAAKQADLKVRRAALAVQAEKKAIEDAKAEIARERAELKAEKELLEADPIAWADKRKTDPDALAKRFLKPKTAEEKRIEELERKLDALGEGEKKKTEEQAAAEREAAGRQQWVTFVGEITSENSPHLVALYEPHEIPAMVQHALKQHGPAFQEEHGRLPTNAEIRAYLERQAASRAKQLLEKQRASLDTSAASGTPEQSDNGSGHQATNGPKTLTNTHASQAASGKTRAKTREERRAELVARLEAEEREARATT